MITTSEKERKKLIKELEKEMDKGDKSLARLKAQSPPAYLIPELKQRGIYNPDWEAS